jgi:hypothetical protein
MAASETVRRARWIESETIYLKQMGLSFDAIAEQITRVGLGQATPMVAIPEGVTFPAGYRITKQACHKAFRKAFAREPALQVEEMRKLDNARSEEMFMNLQPGIRKGNARSIAIGIKLLDHSARINSYAAPQRHEPTDPLAERSSGLTIGQLLEHALLPEQRQPPEAKPALTVLTEATPVDDAQPAAEPTRPARGVADGLAAIAGAVFRPAPGDRK